MTNEQIIEVCKLYDEILEKDGFQIIRENDEFGSLNHCRWMLNEIGKFLPQKIEKANRWLGFTQGLLWAHGYCSIENMRAHNRSKPIDETLEGKKSFMMYGD